MAAESLSFAMGLADGTSPVAKEIASSLGQAEDALKKTTKAAEAAAAPLAKVGLGGKAFGVLAKGAAAFAAAVPAALLAAGGAVAGYALHHEIAADRSSYALRTVIGDTEKANAALRDAEKFSNFFGVDPQETEASLTKLVNKGYDVAAAFRIMQGSMDLGRITGDSKKLIDVFAEMSAKGKVEGEAVAQLAQAGVNPEKLRKILLGGLASTSGNATKDIEAAIAGGQINVTKLQAAALRAIRETTGQELGALALEGSRTLGGLIAQAQTLPARLFQAASTGNALDPLRVGLASLMDQLNPDNPGGQKVVAAIGRVSDSIGTLLAKVSADDVAAGIGFFADTLLVVADVIQWTASTLSETWDALTSGFADATAGGGDFADGAITLTDIVQGLATTIKFTGYVIGYAVGVIYALVDSFVSLGSWAKKGIDDFRRTIAWSNWGPDFVEGIESLPGLAGKAFERLGTYISEKTTSVIDTVKGFGMDIVTGIWDGIVSVWDDFIAGWNGLVDQLPSAVADKLKIASPSKVMFEYGVNTVDGFTGGVASKDGEPASALAAIIDAPYGDVVNNNATNAPSVSIVVNLYGNATEESADMLRDKLGEMLFDMGLQAGAAA